jgi:hypothetical protein
MVVSDWWLSLQPPADAGSLLADFSALKMEAIRSSETSVNPGSTQRHIQEDDILHKLSRLCSSVKRINNKHHWNPDRAQAKRKEEENTEIIHNFHIDK